MKALATNTLLKMQMEPLVMIGVGMIKALTLPK